MNRHNLKMKENLYLHYVIYFKMIGKRVRIIKAWGNIIGMF